MNKHYNYDNVPPIRDISSNHIDNINVNKLVNILNDPYNKNIFDGQKFNKMEGKELTLGSIVRVWSIYGEKWGIISGIEVKEFPKILPSHNLSKNKTEIASTYYVSTPVGFNDESYGSEVFTPSMISRLKPMELPFDIDTIEKYKDEQERDAQRRYEDEMSSPITISKRQWLDVLARISDLEEEIKYCQTYPKYEEY